MQWISRGQILDVTQTDSAQGMHLAFHHNGKEVAVIKIYWGDGGLTLDAWSVDDIEEDAELPSVESYLYAID